MSVYTRELISEQYPADNTPEFFPATMSTEQPVWRVGGVFGQGAYEVLVHDADAIDYSYASVMPVLKDHDQTEQVGTVERVELVGKSLRGVLRFSKNDDGQEVKQDVLDGIRKSLSIGYQILKAAKRVVDGTPFVYVTRWLPVEVSVVSVPADVNAGFYRSATDLPDVELVDETVEQQTTEKVDDGGVADVSIHVNNNAESQTKGNALGEQKEEVQQEPIAEEQAQTRAQDVPALAIEDVEADAAQVAAEAERTQKEAELAAIHESERVENLRSIAKTYHVPDSVLLEYIGDKTKTEADLLSAVRNLKTNVAIPATKKEKNMEFSILSEIAKLAAGDTSESTSQLRSLAENEQLGLNTVGKNILVPVSALTRTLSSNTAGSGKELQTVEEGALIEALTPQSRLMQLGITSLTGLNAAIRMPKLVGSTTAYFAGESSNGGIVESGPSTTEIELKPRRLIAKTKVTAEMLASAGNKDVEALLRADLIRQFALKLDEVAFNGLPSVAAAPHGVWNTAGVLEQSFSTQSVENFRDGVDKILAANAAFQSLKVVTTVGGAAALKKIETLPSSVNSKVLWEGEAYSGKVLGYYDAFISNKASTTKGAGNNEHVLIVGDWSQFIMGQFGSAISIKIVESESNLDEGTIVIHATMLVDFAIRHPESFVKYTGFIA